MLRYQRIIEFRLEDQALSPIRKKELVIVNWITMTGKSGKHLRATHPKHWTAVSTLLGIIRSVIPWSPPVEIEPANTEWRAETLSLSPQSTSHTNGAKLTSHHNFGGHLTWMCLASYIRTLYKGHGHLQGHVFPGGLEIRIRIIIITSRATI